MKKIVLALCIFMVVFLENVSASNKEELHPPKKFKIETGFIFAPQGSISLMEKENVVGMTYPFYVAASFKINNLSITPCYEFMEKSAGVFIEQVINKKNECIAYSYLSVNKHDSYYSIGFGKGLHNGSFIFLEMGSVSLEWNPKIYLGVSIPFMFDLY